MLQDDIQDDEYVFGDSNLSKREKKELEYKKTVLNLAKDYKKAGDLEKVDRLYVSLTKGIWHDEGIYMDFVVHWWNHRRKGCLL